MARPNLSDKPPGSSGRPAVPNRQALTGILFVMRTAIPWECLPRETGCGGGMTCWLHQFRRLRVRHEKHADRELRQPTAG